MAYAGHELAVRSTSSLSSSASHLDKEAEHSSTNSHFVNVHGTLAHAKLTDRRDGPLSLRHLFHPTVTRQYLHAGKLYKEAEVRRPSRFELFFDLAYGGIAHLLAEEAAEASALPGLAKLVLTFYPMWSIRCDVQKFTNVHYSDDVKGRVYILLMVILLYGYSAHAAAVEIVHDPHTGKSKLGEGALEAIHAAAAFFIVAKGARILLYIYYALSLRRFAIPLMISAATTALTSSVFIAFLFVEKQHVMLVLPCIALALEVFIGGLSILFSRIVHESQAAKSGWSDTYIPAINIEHLNERNVQLVVVIFGEALIKSTYIEHVEKHAAQGGSALDFEYGRSAVGILISFTLMWLYYDADSSRTFIHALRRHWISHQAFRIVHFFLVLAILLYSAALGSAITQTNLAKDQHYILAGGVSLTLFCIGALGVLHKSLDKAKSGLLPRSFRIALRFIVAAAIACSPLVLRTKTSSLQLLSIGGLLVVLLAVETFSKLGTVRVDLDEIAEGGSAAVEEKTRKLQKHFARHHHLLTDIELGEEDVGFESGLGQVEPCEVYKIQKIAYTA